MLRELLGRVHGALDEQARWQLLLDAVVAMADDVSLDGLLSHLVESAADRAGAQYAALGVLGAGPGRLRTFITHGPGLQSRPGTTNVPSGATGRSTEPGAPEVTSVG